MTPITIRASEHWLKRYRPCGYDGTGKLVCTVDWMWPSGGVCRTGIEHVEPAWYQQQLDELMGRIEPEKARHG